MVLALCFALTGCGHKSSGIYTEEEMNEMHDITQEVVHWSVAYDNVISHSIPSTTTACLSSDPNFAMELKTANIDPDKPMIALTFDDGPKYSSTSSILKTLKKYNARATFFVVGGNVNGDDEDLIRQMVSQGCEIGNHTYSHVDLTTLDADGIKEEISKTDDVIEKITGFPTKLCRPTGGAVNDTVLSSVDKPLILWYVDTRDWESRDASSIVAKIENYVTDGAIILMHDIYDSTAEAVAQIVPELAEDGYQMVTVSELAYLRGVTLENGKQYYDFTKNDSSSASDDTDSTETETQSST